MTKAIIVFADGSKQMAHNLDDQRLRWHLKRMNDTEEVVEHCKNGIAIPDFGTPDNYKQATEYRAQIQAMIAQINMQQSFVSNKDEYRKQWHQLAGVNQELGRQMMIVKDFIRRENANRSGNSSRDIEQAEYLAKVKREKSELHLKVQLQNDEIVRQKDEIIRLQKLLIEQFGLSESVVMPDRKAS